MSVTEWRVGEVGELQGGWGSGGPAGGGGGGVEEGVRPGDAETARSLIVLWP